MASIIETNWLFCSFYFLKTSFLNKQLNTYFMGHRITIMVDDDNFKKLHTIQAKLIKQSVSSVSFSKILNDTISQCLKKQ